MKARRQGGLRECPPSLYDESATHALSLQGACHLFYQGIYSTNQESIDTITSIGRMQT
jgi:hypothetical protein